MGVRKEAKERTRANVIAAAKRLFADQSYHAVTVRQIAAEAGITTGGVFHIFEFKADVWRAAMGCEPPLDRVHTRFADDLAAHLRNLVEAYRSEGRASVEDALLKAEALLARIDQKA